MVSFPNEYYCSCYTITPDHDELTSENMHDQAGSCMSELIDEIREFFAHLF